MLITQCAFVVGFLQNTFVLVRENDEFYKSNCAISEKLYNENITTRERGDSDETGVEKNSVGGCDNYIALLLNECKRFCG